MKRMCLVGTKRLVKSKIAIDLLFATPALEEKWGSLVPKRVLKKWVSHAIQQDANFVIRLVGNAESKKLNLTFRGQDHATNILTFTMHDPLLDKHVSADLVMCAPVIIQEAKAQGKELLDHFAHLLIHGVLHAQGFDHEDEIDVQAMESLEIAILKGLKIRNPYE